jgi:sporulation protein YlmC with PRC-barrel domain
MNRHIIGLTTLLALASAPLTGTTLAQSAVKAAATVSFVTQQPATEWLADMFIGQSVRNPAGETLGEVEDLLFDRKGQISTAIIGVGGFLGMGEKKVGIPYGMLTFDAGKTGERVIVLALGKADLANAPAFTATEKSTFEKVKAKAVDLGQKTVDKAVELKDQAVKKVDEMRKGDAAKK